MAQTDPNPSIRPSPLSRFAPRRWWVAAALFVLTLAAAWIVSGSLFTLVVVTWLQGLVLLPILAAAAMLGLFFTQTLAKENAFLDTGWPDMARLILSLALGLGFIALGILLAGQFHLLHWSVMLLILLAAGAIGFRPSRSFCKSINLPLLKEPTPRTLLILLLAAVPLAMLMIACTYPPGRLWPSEAGGYDVLEYHLQLPKEYLALNSTAPLAHNAYSFLPANVEMLYLMVMSLLRPVYSSPEGLLAGVLPSAMLHALLAVMAAGAVALSPIKLSAFARGVAFVIVLSVPWTIVTGSLAYDDAGVLLFGALAIGLCIGARSRAQMTMIGLLLGFAVGCKMTSGVMIALPVAAVLLARGRIIGLALATVIALAIYSPWALRSIAATHTPAHIGNPIFPIAARELGLGHWTPEQADKWTRGHEPPAPQPPDDTMMNKLALRQWAVVDEIFCNPQWSTNYATVEQWSDVHPSVAAPAPQSLPFGQRLETIPARWGWLWFVFPIGLAAALSKGRTSWRLLLVVGVQLGAWMFFTHLQSRFFLPGIIPVALLMALGTGRLAAVGIIVAAAVGLQAFMTGFLLLPEPKLFLGPQDPQAMLVDGLDNVPQLFRMPDILLPEVDGKPPVLEENIHTYLVGSATVLYYHGFVSYHTVWDIDPLVEAYKKGGAAGAMQYLRAQKVDYLLVDWNEITRFRKTYGFDPAVTPEMFGAMEKLGLKAAGGNDQVVLYQLK